MKPLATLVLICLLFAACHDEANRISDEPIDRNAVMADHGDQSGTANGWKALREDLSTSELVNAEGGYSFSSTNSASGANADVVHHMGDTKLALAAPQLPSEGPVLKPKPYRSNEMLQGRKIIWDADMTHQVSDVDSATARIQDMVDLNSGFIADMNLSRGAKRISNQIRIRVSNQYFHALVGKLKTGVVKIDSEQLTSNDVTEQFVDLQSRLETKRVARARYMDILRNKTGKIKDVIAAEEAIRKITEEIEAKEGRLRYLQDRVSLCTINLTIYETVEYSEETVAFHKSYGSDVADAFGNGFGFIKNLLLFFATIWPLLVLLGAFAFWKRAWIWKKKA